MTVPSSPVAIASDGSTSIWVASSGPVAGGLNLTVISNAYNPASYAGGTTPVAIAADDSTSGFMWVADQGSYTVRKHSKTAPGTVTVTPVEGRPDKLAYDSGTGSVWMLSIPDQVLTRIRASDGVVLGQYAMNFVPACLTYAATTPATLWICDGTGGGIRKWTVP